MGIALPAQGGTSLVLRAGEGIRGTATELAPQETKKEEGEDVREHVGQGRKFRGRALVESFSRNLLHLANTRHR